MKNSACSDSVTGNGHAGFNWLCSWIDRQSITAGSIGLQLSGGGSRWVR